MLSAEIDEANRIAILESDGPLSKSDFESLAKVIDPYTEKAGQLNGLVIHTRNFPGWDSVAAFATHIGFVKDHHKKISRVAFSTDSVIGIFAETVVSHFVSAEIKLFSHKDLEQAKDWAAGDSKNKPA